MWRPVRRRAVVCPACGRRVPRDDAREYDKHGDRWDRGEKSFEYLCRSCHDAACHQARRGIESTLCDAGAGDVDRSTFLSRFDRLSRTASEPADRR